MDAGVFCGIGGRLPAVFRPVTGNGAERAVTGFAKGRDRGQNQLELRGLFRRDPRMQGLLAFLAHLCPKLGLSLRV